MNNDIKGKTRNFLGKYIRAAELDENTDMFATGIANSLLALQLVLFVEREFGIAVENEDLNLTNFSSLCGIEKFVLAKLVN